VNTRYVTPPLDERIEAETPPPTTAAPATNAQNLSVRVLRTLDELEQIRSVWTAWAGHPHSDLDFLRALIASREEIISPYVIVVNRAGRPDALMAGRLERRDIRYRIGYLPVFRAQARAISFPYAPLRGNPSEENCRAIVRAILDSLKSGEADIATLDYSDIGSPLYKQALTQPGFLSRDLLPVPQPHHLMHIPDSFEKLFQALSGSHRQALRNQARKTEKRLGGRMKFHCFREPAELEEGIRAVEQVARKTYHRGLGVGFEDSPRSRHLMRYHAEKGQLRMWVLFDGDTPITFWGGVVHNGWYYSDHTGFDPEYRDCSPGNYVFVKMLEEFCRDGLQGIDFGLGDALYKQRFGNHTFQEASVNLFAPRAKGMSIKFFHIAVAGVSVMLKKILSQGDLVGKLKRRWRDRLAKGAAES
jgi:Acetyltransferase (GNAT) domain